MSASMPGLDVVARMSSRRPFGGRLVNRTSSACRTALEKRGPIGPQSAASATLSPTDAPIRRSIESTTTTLSIDLYASVKILLMYATFCASPKPTMSLGGVRRAARSRTHSGATSLMNGAPEAMAMVAASAVLPAPAGPWTSTLTSGVRSELRTCSTSK